MLEVVIIFHYRVVVLRLLELTEPGFLQVCPMADVSFVLSAPSGEQLQQIFPVIILWYLITGKCSLQPFPPVRAGAGVPWKQDTAEESNLARSEIPRECSPIQLLLTLTRGSQNCSNEGMCLHMHMLGVVLQRAFPSSETGPTGI